MRHFYFIFLLSLIACGDTNLPKLQRSSNIIHHEKMVDILKEVHYAESKVNIDKINTAQSKKRIENYYSDILASYNYSEDDFYESMDYYYQVPDTLNKIYTKVIEAMSKDQSILRSKLEED
tara:strand:+ start:237 stop:599 length:363 start_codon:yes stop_codon:yes gene_type:complete